VRDTIKNLLNDHREKHSYFQIENFIIGCQGSDWFQYRQCLREIKARWETLEMLKEDLILMQIPKPSKFRFFVKSDRMKKRIMKRREARKISSLTENISEVEREIKKLINLALKLKKSIGDIDDEKREALEADSWYQKARKMAAVDIMVHGGISKQTMDFILSLPKADLKNILLEIRHVKPETILQIE